MGNIDSKKFAFEGEGKFKLGTQPTKIKDFYEEGANYETILTGYQQKIDELQSKMYAHDRHGLVVIIQAFDAAGKDGTIKAVFSGINPAGIIVKYFKRPSEIELDHDFMWRTNIAMAERGRIYVFNRSYYEEVLVVKVHPEIVTNYQKLPKEYTGNLEKLWENRYADIKNLEKYLNNNGISVLKIFLNVSKKEQGERQIARIQDITKNWKFQEGDIKERAYWNDYMNAYEAAINQTATRQNPWYIVPADDKKNMRLIVSQIVLDKLEGLEMDFPETSPERAVELQKFIDIIKEQDAGL